MDTQTRIMIYYNIVEFIIQEKTGLDVSCSC